MYPWIVASGVLATIILPPSRLIWLLIWLTALMLNPPSWISGAAVSANASSAIVSVPPMFRLPELNSRSVP